MPSQPSTLAMFGTKQDSDHKPLLKMEKRVQRQHTKDIKYPFWMGGSASCGAVCLTHPIDLVKVRMQSIQPKRGVITTIQEGIRSEGVLGLYAGLTAGLARQILYGATRFAIYEQLKDSIPPNSATGTHSTNFCILASGVGGFVGGVVGTPADLANVRMQTDAAQSAAQRRGYRNVFHAWSSIYQEGGPRALFRGVWPNSIRASIVTSCQLGCYDVFKNFIIRSGVLGGGGADGAGGTMTHLAASIMAGLVSTTVCNPIDVVKSQIMHGSGARKGVLEVLKTNVAHDAFKWMFRGWLPSFARVGPHTVATLVLFEQHKKIYRRIKGVDEE